jgi:serine phosphatase RsbU (regulator of sigma subunit)
VGPATLSLALVTIGCAYELLMLAFVRRAIRIGRDIPGWVWPVNIFIETMMPTTALLMLAHAEFSYGYRALVAPAVLVYFFFIILSSLRLRPSLCLLTGLFSALSYAAVVEYVYHQFPDPDQTLAVFPLSIHMTCVLMLGLGGVIAGFVTREVRTHVAAALREAQARQQVEQMEHDLDIARSIQRGLLPSQSPKVQGYDIAGWSQSADQTGGDYYDWQPLTNGRLAISLADVSGHGIGPALVSAVCRAYSRASMPTRDELEPIMTHINDLLVEDLPDNRFVTFVAAVLSDASPSVQLLSAGHGPLYFYEAADDRIHSFNAHGIPFGIAPEMSYGPVQTLNLKSGDAIILLTDGFFEWPNPDGEQFGTERLGQAIQTAHGMSPQAIITHLYQTVLAFAKGTPQADDLTAVVIKRC